MRSAKAWEQPSRPDRTLRKWGRLTFNDRAISGFETPRSSWSRTHRWRASVHFVVSMPNSVANNNNHVKRYVGLFAYRAEKPKAEAQRRLCARPTLWENHRLMSVPTRSLGAALIALREKRGRLHQAEAARRIGIGKGELSRYENDKVTPGTAALEKILDCYGVSLVGLLFGAADEPKSGGTGDQPTPVSPEDAQGALRDHEEMLRRRVEDLSSEVEEIRREQENMKKKVEKLTAWPA